MIKLTCILRIIDFCYGTVIIYKFTQENLRAKKIARSRFQSPVKKKNRKLRLWRPTVAIVIKIKSHSKYYLIDLLMLNVQRAVFQLY